MPGYKITEVGVIPEDWKDASLGEFAEIRMCKRIFSEQTKPSGDIPFFKIGTFGRTPDAFIPCSLYREYRENYSFPRKGDILLSAAGTLGRTVVYDGRDAYFQDSNIVWLDIDCSKIKNEYLYHCYQSIRWASPEGSTISRLYNGIIRKTKIPLPPTVNEQCAIATALSDVDALLAKLDQLIAKKRDLKQATMQQLLTGQTRLPGFSGEWEVKRLGDVADMGSGGTPLSSVAAYYDGDIPWVSISDMTKGGKIIELTDRNLTEFGFANSAAQLFPVGTILYAMYASLGECSIAGIPLCTSQAILGIRPREKLYGEFLFYYLTSLKATVKTLGQQGTQANLNKGMVQNFRLNLPSLEEQAAIANVLSGMDAELTRLEARRNKTCALKQGMMQELLTGKIRLI